MPTIPWGDNKMQWNLSQIKNISLKNAFKVVIYKISAILFWALVYQSLSDLAVNGAINRTLGIGERSIKSYCWVPRNAFTVAGAIKWPQW